MIHSTYKGSVLSSQLLTSYVYHTTTALPKTTEVFIFSENKL